jgi:hypothetical protein
LIALDIDTLYYYHLLSIFLQSKQIYVSNCFIFPVKRIAAGCLRLDNSVTYKQRGQRAAVIEHGLLQSLFAFSPTARAVDSPQTKSRVAQQQVI